MKVPHWILVLFATWMAILAWRVHLLEQRTMQTIGTLSFAVSNQNMMAETQLLMTSNLAAIWEIQKQTVRK